VKLIVSFYSISYKTQIVGGVVHRIPITVGAVIEVSGNNIHIYMT